MDENFPDWFIAFGSTAQTAQLAQYFCRVHREDGGEITYSYRLEKNLTPTGSTPAVRNSRSTHLVPKLISIRGWNPCTSSGDCQLGRSNATEFRMTLDPQENRIFCPVHL